MAEAFVKTFKRDYVSVNPTPDAETVMAQLPFWFEHYNNLHPHSALGYQSPREFISSHLKPEHVRSFGGNSTRTTVSPGSSIGR